MTPRIDVYGTSGEGLFAIWLRLHHDIANTCREAEVVGEDADEMKALLAQLVEHEEAAIRVLEAIAKGPKRRMS